jgi:hypothetical protein
VYVGGTDISGVGYTHAGKDMLHTTLAVGVGGAALHVPLAARQSVTLCPHSRSVLEVGPSDSKSTPTVHDVRLASQTRSVVAVAGVGLYVSVSVQSVRLRHPAFDVGVAGTSAHVPFTARQSVTLWPHTRSVVAVGGVDWYTSPSAHCVALEHARSVVGVGTVVWKVAPTEQLVYGAQCRFVVNVGAIVWYVAFGVHVMIVEEHTRSDVKVGGTVAYVLLGHEVETLWAQTTSLVAVGRTDDQVRFTARQLVTLSHRRSVVNVGGPTCQVMPA